MECEVGVSRCKVFYKEWINKVLLYSTEIYIQYPMINYNGKEYLFFFSFSFFFYLCGGRGDRDGEDMEKNILKNVCI